MNAAAFEELIDVKALRVGMFVHLDGGWLSHPFPLSSFRISSTEQIATIAALGLAKVRWSPRQSDDVFAAAHDALHALAAPAEAASPAAVTELTATATATAVARAAHRHRLAEQRAGLSLCEKQFSEAALACRRANEMVAAQPREAGVQALALSQALVDKMLGAQELCIRLLTDAAGDKVSVHALNVSVISLLMGRTLGLSTPDMNDLGVGALMHDIGKLELPDRVRHREDHFTAAELRFYEDHVTQGATQARRMGLSAGAMLVLAQHHEHADGTGFPLRLNRDRMSVASRIVALVNRYDNLCNPNLVSKAVTPHEALAMLFAQGKSKYDAAMLSVFIKMMGVYPPGSTVQLTDDRYAMVVGVNSSRPLKPRVLVHNAKVAREEALVLDLEQVQGLGIRRSIKPVQLPGPVLDYLSPRPRVAYFFEPARELDMSA